MWHLAKGEVRGGAGRQDRASGLATRTLWSYPIYLAFQPDFLELRNRDNSTAIPLLYSMERMKSFHELFLREICVGQLRLCPPPFTLPLRK